MRYATLLVAMWFAAVPASADFLQATGLSTNGNGQVTANYQSGNSFFDIFVDIQNADGSSRCLPSDPCFPINSAGTSLKSRQFDSGQFQVSFEAMMNGSPVVVDAAGLNQEQKFRNSFFDVYFDLDLGNGTHQGGLLGLHMTPDPTPANPDQPVTGPGAITYPAFSRAQPGDPCRTAAPTDPCRATFFLDPMAFETFDITIQTSPTLTGPPPLLTPNPNVVPEPSSLLLLVTVAAGLLIVGRRSMKKLSNEC